MPSGHRSARPGRRGQHPSVHSRPVQTKHLGDSVGSAELLNDAHGSVVRTVVGSDHTSQCATIAHSVKGNVSALRTHESVPKSHNADMDEAWFRARMRHLKVTQADIGVRLARDRTAVSKLLKGTRSLQLSEVNALAEILEVPVLEILFRAGLWRSGSVAVVAVPVMTAIRGGAFTPQMVDEFAREFPLIYVESRRTTLIALRVEGDSMNRVAPGGSVVVIDYDERDLRNGDLGAFRYGGEATFKRYRTDGVQAWLEPDSDNPRHVAIFPSEGETVEIIGKVIETRPGYTDEQPIPRASQSRGRGQRAGRVAGRAGA